MGLQKYSICLLADHTDLEVHDFLLKLLISSQLDNHLDDLETCYFQQAFSSPKHLPPCPQIRHCAGTGRLINFAYLFTYLLTTIVKPKGG